MNLHRPKSPTFAALFAVCFACLYMPHSITAQTTEDENWTAKLRAMKLTYKLRLEVTGDAGLKEQGTSYLTRELRSIPDIVLDDAKYEYVLRVDLRSISNRAN